jgi:hypothetical protein
MAAMEESPTEPAQTAPAPDSGEPSSSPASAPGQSETLTAEAAAPPRRRRRWPLHPFLFAIYPVLALYSANLGEASPDDLVVPLVGVIVGTLVLYAIGRVVLRSSGRAALAATLLVVVFFAYGRVLQAVDGSPIGGGRLLLVAAVVVVVGLALIVLIRRNPERVNRALEVAGALLVVVAIGSIAVYELPRALRSPAVADAAPPVAATTTTTRDIYYIVVEDLGSPKTLTDHFGLTDTHAFDWLDELGFKVGERSATNYGKTVHMLASTLNMEYLDEFAKTVGPAAGDQHPLVRLIDDNEVARFLKSQGYRYVHIGSWWDPTEKSSIADANYGISAPSDFTSALIDTTILPEVIARLPRLGIRVGLELSGDEGQYDGAIFGFGKIKELAATPGPKFVFAHILIPHEPFVFRADGTRLTPEERAKHTDKQNFLGQALYTTSQLEAVARTLLSGPEATRPIVIIQTDEGPNPPGFSEAADHFDWTAASQEELEIKYPILNAFYLPGLADPGVYPEISTVNTFRLVLGRYFGADLPLLPDRLYTYRDKAHLYDFNDITDRLLP